MSKPIKVKAIVRKYDTSYGLKARLIRDSNGKNMASPISYKNKVKGGNFLFKVNPSKFNGSKKEKVYLEFKNINGNNLNFIKGSKNYLIDPKKQEENSFKINIDKNKSEHRVLLAASIIPTPAPGPSPSPAPGPSQPTVLQPGPVLPSALVPTGERIAWVSLTDLESVLSWRQNSN